jgi:hypothetical protein
LAEENTTGITAKEARELNEHRTHLRSCKKTKLKRRLQRQIDAYTRGKYARLNLLCAYQQIEKKNREILGNITH